MKQLLIIRHAKSSWDFTSLSDFDRELNDRGHKDAPAMAKRLIDKSIFIDAFISSTAVRAFTTAKYFANAYQLKEKDIKPFNELYHASADTIFDVIAKTGDELQSIAVFTHNPGVTDFVNMLTTTQIDDMPTCGIFAVKVHCDSWANFKDAKKEFWFFDYPKNV
jgi:phosphohistidine phosphatase